MTYLSIAQTAKRWRISSRRIQVLCREGRVSSAVRIGHSWQFRMMNQSLPMQESKAESISRRNRSLRDNYNNDRTFGSDREIPKKGVLPLTTLLRSSIRRTICTAFLSWTKLSCRRIGCYRGHLGGKCFILVGNWIAPFYVPQYRCIIGDPRIPWTIPFPKLIDREANVCRL